MEPSAGKTDVSHHIDHRLRKGHSLQCVRAPRERLDPHLQELKLIEAEKDTGTLIPLNKRRCEIPSGTVFF